MLLPALMGCTPEPPPSILIVVMDTVRADALGAYGNPRAISPQFDAVAAAGALFEDVTAPGSWTWPTHASLFTGEPPWVHGAHTAADGQGTALDPRLKVTPMRGDLPTLAERLGQAGYDTAAYVSNALLARERGLTRGFDEVRVFGEDGETTRAALAGLAGPEPQLVFVNYMGAHAPHQFVPASWTEPWREQLIPGQGPAWVQPYLSPPLGVGFFEDADAPLSGIERFARGELKIPPEGLRMLRDLYEGEVMAVDAELNVLLKRWVELHPSGVVFVTSDHGEQFGEHGLLAHGSVLYSQLTRVPLAVVAPGRVAAGQRSRNPVQLQDIYATALELAGVEDAPWTLLDALAGAPRPAPILAAEWPRQRYAESVGGELAASWRMLREGPLAVIAGSNGRIKLYDLDEDPGMTKDLTGQQPARAYALAEDAYRLIPMGDGLSSPPDAGPSDTLTGQHLMYLE